MDFNAFRDAFNSHFDKLKKHPLFVTATPSEELWETYLKVLAPYDPIFKERQGHDCSCCRHFMRDMGNVFAFIDGRRVSVWDFEPDNEVYAQVVKQLSVLALSQPTAGPFLSEFNALGVALSRADIDGRVINFPHFRTALPSACIVPKRDVDSRRGKIIEQKQMLQRALSEICPDAVDDVLDLIASGSLYRGDEHRAAVRSFKDLQSAASIAIADVSLEDFCWRHSNNPLARIRNTVIGTLLVDLSEGRDLEAAVKSYEDKTAPTNYKRPKALVTPAMVESAKKKVAELGLTSALDRRYANLTDVSINDILFADRNAKAAIKDADPFDNVATKSGKAKSFDRIDSIPMDKFLADVLPLAETIEIMFENRHAHNLVSLVTAADPAAAPLFKWGNPFTWSYNGDVTDAIKERVRAKGGNVTGELCCRLAWNNYDDLDFHLHEEGGYEIYYGTRGSKSPNGGQLDVDANAGGGGPGRGSRDPVENIFYARLSTMRKGTYKLYVHQYRKVEMKDNEFVVEIDLLGDVMTFSGRNPGQGARADIARIISDGQGNVSIKPTMESTAVKRTMWGLQTGEFQRVSAAMLSPNHWGEDAIGHKHYLFMIDGCVNDENARGFYNEFLRADLDEHRKVLELVGSRQRTGETTNQLSGLGFSSTVPTELVVRVSGKSLTRTLKVTI